MRRVSLLLLVSACGAPRSAPPVPLETMVGSTSATPSATSKDTVAKRGYVCPEAARTVLPSDSPSTVAPTSSSGPAPSASASSTTPKAMVVMRETGTDIRGRLPPTVIKRILRANFPRIRACYVGLLKRDPTSKGLVATEFIIGQDGHPEWADARSAGTTIVDEAMLDCVERVFACITFPAPEEGRVFVRYPVGFELAP